VACRGVRWGLLRCAGEAYLANNHLIALAWPSVTVLALVILFAVYAFSDSVAQGMRAFSGGSAGPVIGHLPLGLIDIAAGLVAIVWPGPTALLLVFVVAAWAVADGIVEFVAGFGAGETAGTRALFLIGGLVSSRSGAGATVHSVLRKAASPDHSGDRTRAASSAGAPTIGVTGCHMIPRSGRRRYSGSHDAARRVRQACQPRL
jgi:uncharacterized membrane protein HdeD (DUF308 family)